MHKVLDASAPSVDSHLPPVQGHVLFAMRILQSPMATSTVAGSTGETCARAIGSFGECA
jgi:hypothetical protein